LPYPGDVRRAWRMKTSMWKIELREDQFEILQLLIDRSINEANSGNKSWLPMKIAKIELVELANYLMEMHG
jgi:hypothetical protein